MRQDQLSIRHRLRRSMMLTSLTAIALVCLGFVTCDLIDQREHLDHDLSTLADVIGSNSLAALTFGDAQSAREILGAVRSTPSIVAACIYAKDGSIFATYSTTQRAKLPARPLRDGVRHDGDTVEVFHTLRDTNGDIEGTIYLASDLRDLGARLRKYLTIVIFIVIVSILAAFVLSSRLQRAISAPIIELARVTLHVSQQRDYSLRADSLVLRSSQGEIGDLVRGFNGMLGEIQRRDAALLTNQDQLERQVERRTYELVAAKERAENTAKVNADLHRKNELVLDSIADGILGLDAEGHLTFMNPAAVRILGRSPETLIGKGTHDVIHHTTVDGCAYSVSDCPIYKTLGDGVPREVHTEVFWRRDGSSFPVEYLVAPMRDSEERITGVTLTFRDTTERRAVEKMKDEFVSTVSHELRTPLTSIRGALGLLNSGMLGVTNEKAARMLQIAVSNTDRLVRLINDILDLERIDSGRIELIRKDADALHLMTQTVDGVATMAQQARVAIVVEPVVASVWLDWDRVTQTLTNLVSNAVKFSPAGSTVTIGGSTADDGTFTFRVSDQGRGVPEEKLEMIFERFKQVDASDSRDKGGTGLGLAICRSIVTAHGGRIWAQRNQPCGTLFQFTIPPKPNEAGEVTSSRTVLVCHDEVTRTDAVSAILEQNHFQIVDVPSPADLIDRAAAVQPDAIVLDLASAPSDAWRIIDKLQESETTRHVPVIVAVGDAPLSGETCANGIAKWVRAPLPNEELIDAVEEACRGPLILIVEDDADLARVMAESLHSRGIRTLHALDGQRAVELCREHNPTLVVLDLILPRMDGFAVVEELRHDSSRRSLPLLVYSALEVNQAEQDRLRLGPTEFLTKSRCSLQEFEVHVVKLLNTVAKEEREHAA